VLPQAAPQTAFWPRALLAQQVALSLPASALRSLQAATAVPLAVAAVAAVAPLVKIPQLVERAASVAVY
jgi:hypothetical protein